MQKKPFNFNITEKFTVAEDTSYLADIAAMHSKLYKKIKLEVLEKMIDDLSDSSSNTSSKQTDTLQKYLQKKISSAYKRDITSVLQSPGGAEQFVSDEYCKAFASCFDPHTEFFPLTEKENFESELGNEHFRFGFTIKEDDAGGVIINGLEPGSPAFKCGLLNKGDKFKTLQWEGQSAIDVSDATAASLIEIVSQSNHNRLIITVVKEDGTLRTVTLMKEQKAADDDTKVKSFVLKGANTFGYISLPAFYSNWEDENTGDNGCANDVAKEILKLKKENIQGLILDLRYNGGGSLQEAVEMAGIFIDAGPVMQIQQRSAEKIFTLKDVNRGTVYDGPLIILVNGYSASASEVLAGTLQDYNRALIVGSATYGKATGQVVLPLDSSINSESDTRNIKADNYLKVTDSKLFRVNGTSAQFSGVTPDIILPDLLQADPNREADEPFALQPSTIDANKYYKPYSPLQITTLQSEAKHEADTMKYFTYVKDYIHQYKLINTSEDLPLSFKEMWALEKADSLPVKPGFNYASTYNVANNDYDKQQLTTITDSNDINTAFINYLSHDAYIKICIDMLSLMAK